MKNIFFTILCLFSQTFVIHTFAVVRMPKVFGDNMVLQQQVEAKLWGRADGKTVVINTSWDNQTYQVRPDKEGRWKLAVKTPEAGGPYVITVSDGKELVLNNIMIGEVWICSGQSNMAVRLKGYMSQPIKGSAEAIMTSGKYRDRIRVLNLPQRASDTPEEDFPGISWNVSDPVHAPEFSAVAFFFARYLTESLGVPVGIINSSWGGSNIEAWMDEESNRKARPEIKIHDSELPVAKQPVKLYNGLICPIAGYTARGFIWYQGEGNARKGGLYKWYSAQLEALVSHWRKIWNNEKMPFYIVQIAPHNNGDAGGTWFPRLVEQQIKAARTIPGCGIVSTTDVGEPDCIHPADKQAVGLRLAYLAMGSLYRKVPGTPLTGPLYKSHRFERGNAIVEFDNASLGLVPIPGQLEGFEMAGKDRVFHPARAVVNGKNRSTVTVQCDRVPEPVAVRYAFRNYMVANLANSLGFPAFPFRTDNWEE